MPGKLDQSLDQIMTDSKPAGGPGGRGRFRRPARRAATKAKAAIAAPTGGIQKQTKVPNKPARTVPPPVRAPASGESKIVVSNLPLDVTEGQIQEYFSTTIGHVRTTTLAYGPNGKSRGIATIIFSQAASAPKAAKEMDGVHVDKRPMKVEVVLGAKHAPAPPAPKALADRMGKPKSAAKEKAKTNPAPKANGAATANGAGKAGRRGGKSGRTGRPKKKTAEELDAEMMDYFGPGENPTSGTAQPAAVKADGDAGMVVDDVM